MGAKGCYLLVRVVGMIGSVFGGGGGGGGGSRSLIVLLKRK